MTGIELLLSTILCLTCSNDTAPNLPKNLLPFPDNGVQFDITLDPSNSTEIALDDAPTNTMDSITEKRIKLQKLRDWINGRHLRIATLDDYPLSYTELQPNGTVLGKGVSFDLINFLRTKFNFTYEVIVPANNIIGSKFDFDNSLLQILNDSSADIAAAFLPLLSEQREFIYYSTTTLDEGEWIMVMQRPRESASGSGLMAPFDFWVWVLIFVSLLAVGPIIYCLIILRNKLTGDTEQKPYSLGHCAWFVYGALMKQGSTLSPIADSTRLLFATWWIFITILTSFYTANLTAFLTLSKFTLPFNNVNDILYKSKHFVTTRGGGVEYAIRGENESLSILNRMIQTNLAVFTDIRNDTVNLQNYVEKSGYVFVRDRPAINHVLYHDYRYRKTISIDNEKIHCPFAKAKDPFLRKKRAFAYPKSSNLSDLFDPELLNLVESGIIKHLSSQGVPNAEICPQDLGGTERQLRNGDLMMTYYIMLAGFATSIVVFTTELIFRFINYRQENNKWARHGIGRLPDGRAVRAPVNWLRASNERLRLSVTPPLNITPPPPYQSIFNNSGSQLQGNNLTNLQRWRRGGNLDGADVRGHGVRGVVSKLAAGAGVVMSKARYKDNDAGENTGVRRYINGRDYMVYRNTNGQSQLIPVRSPSATLFQYTYTE